MKDSLSALPVSFDPAYSFGEFRLEADGTLLRGKSVVHLPPKELAALRLLLQHAGQIVTPLQLRNSLWGEVHVTADSIPKCLSSLRARLEPEQPIQTVYKRGYRFTAAVSHPGAASNGVLPRLAIVPFATGYAVPEHLGLAIAEETALKLTSAAHPVVSVMARDSVFALIESKQTAQQIGQALKADLVLTGTLRNMSTFFRLRAEMIRVEDGTQIWVEEMLVPQSCIAGLETDLVQRLVLRIHSGAPSDGSLLQGQSHEMFSEIPSSTGLRSGLTSFSAGPASPGEPRTEANRYEAYKIFLHGHYEWQTLQRHRMQDGMQHLHKAIEIDPSLIPARVDIVNICVAQALFGFMPPTAAADCIRRCVESNPPLLQHTKAILPALGWINFHIDRNLPAAIRDFSRSAHLPHAIWTTHLRVIFALSRQRFAEAVGILRAALHEDPYSPWLQARLAWAFHLAGRTTESVDQIRRTIERFPTHKGALFHGSLILAYNGEATQAAQMADGLSEPMTAFDPATANQAYALACQGYKDEAHAILERLQWMSRERFVLKSFIPAVYVVLGDHEAAIAELHAADEARCPWFFQMLSDPRLTPLHDHPEFTQMQSLLTTMEDEAARGALEPEFG